MTGPIRMPELEYLLCHAALRCQFCVALSNAFARKTSFRIMATIATLQFSGGDHGLIFEFALKFAFESGCNHCGDIVGLP